MTLALWMGAGAGLGGLGQRDGQHNTHAEDKVKRSLWGKGEGGCGYLCPSRCRWTEKWENVASGSKKVELNASWLLC